MTSHVLEVRAFFQTVPTEADEARIGVAFSLLKSSGIVLDMVYRRARKMESMTYSERRVHFDGKPCITKFNRGYARLTSDWSQVTCRKCLRHRPKSSSPKIIENLQQWDEHEREHERTSPRCIVCGGKISGFLCTDSGCPSNNRSGDEP